MEGEKRTRERREKGENKKRRGRESEVEVAEALCQGAIGALETNDSPFLSSLLPSLLVCIYLFVY